MIERDAASGSSKLTSAYSETQVERYSIKVTLFPPGNSGDDQQKAWGFQTRLLIDPEVAHLISSELALELMSVPIARQGMVLVVAMCNTDDLEAYSRLRDVTGLRLRPVAATADDICQVIPKVYARRGGKDAASQRPSSAPLAGEGH